MRYLVLLVAAFVIAAPTGATTTARVLHVTAGVDGAPGSLRNLVERVAKPGDRIVFPTALRIELRRKLTIPRSLAGLTIDGSTAAGVPELVGVRSRGGTFIQVDADRVTLRRLKLNSVPVVFESHAEGGQEVGPRFARVLDVETTGSLPGRAGLKFSFARAFQVRGGRITNSISLTGTQGGLISDVTLAAKGTAVSDENSDLLRLEANTLESGRIALQSQGVAVARNQVKAGATLHVWIVAGGSGRIDANRIEGGRIVAQAGGELRVGNNVISGTWRRGVGLPGISAGCATDGKRPRLAVNGNTVTGMRVGISVVCGRDAQISLQHNTLERNGTGMLVAAREVSIVGGKVSENIGAGIHVRAGSRATISKIAAGGNGGLAIDREDAEPRPPKLEYDKDKDRIRGVTCPECIVELYAAEEGDEAGEGLGITGTVRASSNGSFVYPATGTVQCPHPALLTATATRVKGKDKGTSEFSADLKCEPIKLLASATYGAGGPRTNVCVFVRVGPPQVAKGSVTMSGPSGGGTREFETSADGNARVVFPVTAFGRYTATVKLLGKSTVTAADVGSLSGDPIGCRVG